MKSEFNHYSFILTLFLNPFPNWNPITKISYFELDIIISKLVLFMKQIYATMTKLEKLDENNLKFVSHLILEISFLTLFECGVKITSDRDVLIEYH